jgi:pimeloyl-ACP methyl ester carboxylesterase
MNFVYDAEGRRVAYHFDGPKDKPPLVLLHGFCEDSSVWSALLPMLQNVPTLCVDLPGFGQSDLPAAPTVRAYATAVLRVLDAENLPRSVLVGHSLGGYVALECAAGWPARWAGLGLFHSHPFADTPERRANRQRGIEMLQSGKRDLYVSQLFPNLFAPDFASAHTDVLNSLIDNGKRQSPEGIATALQAMMTRRDHSSTLQNLACPAQFLLGDSDALIPLDDALRAALQPAVADVRVLKGVGHMGMWEAPADAAAAMADFWGMCLKTPIA